MENQQQSPTNFLSSVDVWASEITGNIARVNDAAAALKFELYKPNASNNRLVMGDKVQISGTFIKAVNVLYLNVSQVLSIDTKKKINAWLNDVMKMMAKNASIPDTMLLNGIELAELFQDELYDIGLKEIGVDDPFEFPFEYYKDLIQ